MADQRDYYQILQISPHADAAIIKSAYYTHLRTLKKHPDLGGSHEEATLLNEAYEILSDPQKRKEYDQKYQPPKEQRRVVRLPFQQNFRFKPHAKGDWVKAQFRDISRLGACLRTLQSFKAGQIVEMEISQNPKLKAFGKVRWVRSIPQRFGTPIYEGGVEFEKIGLNAFQQFLDKSGLKI